MMTMKEVNDLSEKDALRAAQRLVDATRIGLKHFGDDQESQAVTAIIDDMEAELRKDQAKL